MSAAADTSTKDKIAGDIFLAGIDVVHKFVEKNKAKSKSNAKVEILERILTFPEGNPMI
jgi:hypothetical protein